MKLAFLLAFLTAAHEVRIVRPFGRSRAKSPFEGLDLDRLHDRGEVESFIGGLGPLPAGTVSTLKRAARFQRNLSAAGKPDFNTFFQFIAEHNRTYADDRHLERRFGLFRRNLRRIGAQQARSKTARFGVNQFADLSADEFLRGYTGLLRRDVRDQRAVPYAAVARRHRRAAAPASFDWRTRNIIGPVKNQAGCGCCYAFASAAGAEAAFALQSGQVLDTSEQQIVSCSGTFAYHGYRNYGCSGGFIDVTLQYIARREIALEAADPFVSGNASVPACAAAPRYNLIRGFSYVKNTEAEMLVALYNNGPLVVGLDASPLDSYSSGILDPSKPADGWTVNHAVLLVGYGEADGTPYWTLKNQWSTAWGEQGYFRLVRGQNALDITYMPVVALPLA